VQGGVRGRVADGAGAGGKCNGGSELSCGGGLLGCWVCF
jgi:hypothetical protein